MAPDPPLQDWSLLPRAHERVRLAVRLDEVERKQSKERAERTWREQHAEELGIELSDEEASDGEAVQVKRVGKRAKREAAGRRGPSEEAAAGKLRAQLAALLVEPLQPKLSGKWFTGGRAAAVEVSVRPAPAAAAGPAGKTARRQQQQQQAQQQARGGTGGRPEAEGEGEQRQQQQQRVEGGEGAEGAGGAAPSSAATVSMAVALAQRLADSHSKAAQQAVQQAAQHRRREKNHKQRQAGGPRAAALAAALASHAGGKKQKRRGLVVVPQAFGREATGPDALQTLRQRLAVLS